VKGGISHFPLRVSNGETTCYELLRYPELLFLGLTPAAVVLGIMSNMNGLVGGGIL